MLKRGLVDIIASDAHKAKDYKLFSEVLDLANKYRYDINVADRILKAAF